MLSRYIVFTVARQEDGLPAPLPIKEIMIGPGSQQAFTKLNLQLLLEQQGYSNVLVCNSPVELQNRSGRAHLLIERHKGALSCGTEKANESTLVGFAQLLSPQWCN